MNTLKKVFTFSVVLTTILWSMGAAVFVPVASAVTLSAGDLIKASGAAVYYYAADGKRYTFPTQSTYMTWYGDFSGVKTVTDDELAAIELAGNVVARAGTRLVKITTVPKVFAVEPNGMLRHIASESAAATLFGANWASRVIDVPDGFWVNYTDSGLALDGTEYPAGSLVKMASGADVYYVNTDGTWSKFANSGAFTTNGFAWSDIVTAPSTMSFTAGSDIAAYTASLVDTSQGGGAGSAPTSGGNVMFGLSSSNPAGTQIILDSTSTDGSEDMTSVFKFYVTASGGDAVVDSVRLHRKDITSNTDFATLYLYDDAGTLISDAPSYSNNYYTFGTNFTVSSGTTKTLTLKLDLTNGTSANKTLSFSVDSASDVVLVGGGSVSGSFPVSSNKFETAQVSDLGKMTLATASDPGTSIEAGLTDQELWRFTLAAADQKMRLDSLKLTAVGTLESDTFENLYLYDGIDILGTATSLDSAKTVTFDGLNYEITAGQTKTIQFRGDIVKGTNRTFYFQVQNGYDVMSFDTNYSRYVRVNASDTYTIIAASNTTTISTGSLQISKAIDSPSGSIAAGTTNRLLGKWNFRAIGEDIKVSSLIVRTTVGGALDTDNVDNGKILVNGTQLGTTKDLDSDATADGDTTDDDAAADDDTTFTFGNTFIIPAGAIYVVEIYGDVKTGASVDMAADDTILLTLEAGTNNFFRQSTGTTGSSTASGANALTVADASITPTLNSTVSDMSVVQGAQDVIVGSWVLTAGTAEDVEVSSIAFVDGGAQGIGGGFQNLSLVIGGVERGTSANPSSTNGTSTSINLSPRITISAGMTETITLYADVKDTANAGWNDTDPIAVDSVSGLGIDTSSTVSYSTDVPGQAITVVTAGTLTIAAAAAPTNPTSSYIVAGKTNQTVAAWEFSANNVEDLIVHRLQLTENGTDDNPGNVQNLKLYVDGVQVGSTLTSLTDSTANTGVFYSATGLFTVPKNDSMYVELRADGTATANATFLDDGSDLTFQISNVATQTDTTAVSAKGATSQTYAAGTSANYAGNNHKFVKTKPTFSLESGVSTVLSPTTTEVLRFRITADSNFKLLFDTTSNIRVTALASAADDTDNDETWTLYEYATNTTLDTNTGLDTSDGTDTTVEFNFGSATSTIPAGGYKVYYVEAGLEDYEDTGDSLRLKINNAAADLSFDDGSGSGTADLTNASFAGIGLPLSGPALVK
ncbi:hypothetical protein COT97_04295 [Candidatus Falkowbacteria bacterium CG10_big_fil_rev_8_21_14_0_10_39_11]|uniref:Uncharacterized protein n=1 Tax=Candidatus Falkowbacteria bacterium CG10_big_fil_rev_8_21_14_0_10_39_11 TaxID=1974565 RepID=A0A2H0V485_9BACT|nr:MAG: hypothetical protein COT97_04295 [Candidatus Falkowbacteria bacterium CG10_big_fil_rev_8_21_14_0_10_39_11]